jgi:hypothetical protein
MEPVTAAQRKVICMIEENLDVEFKGLSKLDATLFISTYIEQSKRASFQYVQDKGRLYDARDYQEVDEYDDDDYYGDMWHPGFPYR